MSGSDSKKRKTSRKSSQGPLCIWQGTSFPMWIKLLASRPPMDWTQSLRLALVTGLSLNNSVMGAFESLIYGRRIQQTELVGDPVFIIGHWRSGTTLLHNLLSLDPQFVTPNLYQVLAPHHFLLTESLVTRLTRSLVPKTRPMDNMELSWNAPQEDETALANMTLLSPYVMLAHQGNRPKYVRYFDLHDLTPKELARWKKALLLLMKKLTVKSGKTILLKSPTHSYRVRLLLEMFPGARFINIVRNPYAVIKSTMHLRHTLFEENGLGRPIIEESEEEVCLNYEHLFRVFEEDRGLIPASQFHELRFEELESDPVGEIGKVYAALQMRGFDQVEPQITAQLDTLRKYRKNEFDMDPELMRRVYQRLQPAFERYGYASGLSEPAASTIPLN